MTADELVEGLLHVGDDVTVGLVALLAGELQDSRITWLTYHNAAAPPSPRARRRSSAQWASTNAATCSLTKAPTGSAWRIAAR